MADIGLSELEVGNHSFLIEKLASECSPRQEIRELTVNAFEAIKARSQQEDASYAGRVIWDVDWTLLENSASGAVYKLQICDNGTGMTGEEMDTFIRKLSSSGRQQGLSGNFGVGAKITAGVQNPYGLSYLSWVNGSGNRIWFHKDEERDKYGLRHLDVGGGSTARWAPVDDVAKPHPVDDCGTAVTLMGHSHDENTIKLEGEPSKWLIQYLNARFWVIPDGIELRVRDFNNSEVTNWPTNRNEASRIKMGEKKGSQLRLIKGQKQHLADAKGVVSGVSQLSTAKVYWYLLPESAIQQTDIWDCRAHTAAIFQDELYETRRTRQAYGLIREFGIIFGSDRIVLYVEPDTKLLNVYANTARSQLLVESSGLPWNEWGQEFRQNMPQEIKDMMDGLVTKTGSRDHRDEIKKRLKDIRNLFRVQRYRRNPKGEVTVDGVRPGGSPRPGNDTKSSSGSGGGSGGGKGADPYGAFLKTGGDPASASPPKDNDPIVKWVSVSDGTRAEDDIEDRAAQWVEQENTILANSDFRVFEDFIADVGNRYPGAPIDVVKDVVREWIEQQLIEAVLGIETLKGSPAWDPDQLENALSPEALTTAVMPRYNTLRQITRSLGARVGKGAAEQA